MIDDHIPNINHPNKAKSNVNAPTSLPFAPLEKYPIPNIILPILYTNPKDAEAIGKLNPPTNSKIIAGVIPSTKFWWTLWPLLNINQSLYVSYLEYNPFPVSGYPSKDNGID